MKRVVLFGVVALACNGQTPPPAPQPKVVAPEPSPEPTGPTKGRVVDASFHSDALGVEKDMKIYLPEGYDPAGSKRYPVFYYLHGLGGDETNWTEYGKLEVAANALGLRTIVVMPDGDNHFYVDGVGSIDYEACIKDATGMFIPSQSRKKTCTRTTKYGTYIIKDLIGWVDKTYKTIASKQGRAIAGLSMGGYGALVLALKNPDVFAATASHSGLDALLYGGPYPYEKGKVKVTEDVVAWSKVVPMFGPWMLGIYGSDVANWRAHDPQFLVEKLKPGTLELYLDCGDEDEFLFHHGMQHLHDLMLAKGIEHEYFLGPGRHSFSFWTDRLPKSLAFLRAATSPAR